MHFKIKVSEQKATNTIFFLDAVNAILSEN